MISRHAPGRALLAVTLVATLAGCSSIPTDPDGTLDRASDGTLRVGVTENDDWVSLTDDGDPKGTEVELVSDYAATIDAEVEWVEGSEQSLVGQLQNGEVDLVIGGFADSSPWSDRVGSTQPYTESIDEHGATEKHVLFVPSGENALLLSLDRFLLERGDR